MVIEAGKDEITLVNDRNERFILENDLVGITQLFRVCQDLVSSTTTADNPEVLTLPPSLRIEQDAIIDRRKALVVDPGI